MAPPTMARFTMALFTKVLHGLDGRLEPPLMLPTPLGAVTLLWADEHGLAYTRTRVHLQWQVGLGIHQAAVGARDQAFNVLQYLAYLQRRSFPGTERQE